MRLTDASVTIRPRNPWEAIDLGVLLAREHRTLLMGSWAAVTLPVFALLSFLLWDYPSLVFILFWWLKPAYERLALLILSRALFGPAPTLKQALKAWPATLKNQLIPSLTWRRLSPSRSFLLPVQQLENLSGIERSQRIALLSQKDMRAARCLTIVGSHLEFALWLGLILLFYAFIPRQIELDWSWYRLLNVDGSWNWLEHLSNALYALMLVFWGPIYVSCGFTLYLNRRTTLEAWDIELVFRRLRQRLIGSAYVVLIAAGLALSAAPTSVWADEASAYSCPLPETEQTGPADSLAAPDTPRLTRQALSSEAARNDIRSLLQEPPFKNPKTVSGWRFPEPKESAPKARAGGDDNPFKWLNDLLRSANVIAKVLETLLWATAIALVTLLIWRYREWFKTFVGRDIGKRKPLRDSPEQLFGLAVTAQSLPDDIASHAQRLWASQPREALSLLYRGLLSRLLNDYRLPLKHADTEGQVLEHVAKLNQPLLNDFSRSLTTHWQNLAYGHRLPPAHLQQELCDGWRRLFDTGAPR
ncbi:hypothetical protein ALQ04_04497 [Pseudomonas cichorii]|uniref:Protein-glutamine gamma-glutamyltransferase-like C-terminal domain-containing protein n=1 Tax=Pseudomonas cichorii TaxID=36746 RepID=A0A3M4LVP0_PSECI|nr:DUF4129 domain-containing protein [Pseudomonas cichorii]RMQ45214.1 hypothetical protein ALQ04_04497 [Pseudomonas cichorii]